MILSNLIGFVAFVCNQVSSLGETCGVIPSEMRTFAKQLSESITKLLARTSFKWKKYSRLVDFLCDLLKQNSSGEQISFDDQVVLAPLKEYQVLSLLKEKERILQWHIQHTDENGHQPLKFYQRCVPKECELNQEQLLLLIEDCKFLHAQGQKILQYTDFQLKESIALMTSLFGPVIDKFVKTFLTEQECQDYQELMMLSRQDASLIEDINISQGLFGCSEFSVIPSNQVRREKINLNFDNPFSNYLLRLSTEETSKCGQQQSILSIDACQREDDEGNLSFTLDEDLEIEVMDIHDDDDKELQTVIEDFEQEELLQQQKYPVTNLISLIEDGDFY